MPALVAHRPGAARALLAGGGVDHEGFIQAALGSKGRGAKSHCADAFPHYVIVPQPVSPAASPSSFDKNLDGDTCVQPQNRSPQEEDDLISESALLTVARIVGNQQDILQKWLRRRDALHKHRSPVASGYPTFIRH